MARIACSRPAGAAPSRATANGRRSTIRLVNCHRNPMSDAPEYPELIEAVRVLAIEESPLWEVLQEVDSRMPDKKAAGRLDIAVRTVAHLLATDAVELAWTLWTATGVEWRVASAADNETILSNPQYWHQTSRYETYVEIHYIYPGETPHHRLP